jgi:hypothetical protein
MAGITPAVIAMAEPSRSTSTPATPT